jgi:hypothetical protein
MNPCTLEKGSLALARESWLFPKCGAPKPWVGSVDVHIQGDRPGDAPLTFVNGCGVILAHRDLIAALKQAYAQADLLLGSVKDSAGQAITDWLSVRSRHRVIVRGSKNVSHRRCDECGRHVYFAMGGRYLYPAPPAEASISETDLYGLLVTPNVLDGVVLSRWSKLGVEKLRVAAQPKDSLGELG